ncbi:hypothetical protein RA269_28465, partial [Pseudomonas syringae pv. tagetis]|uniref:hypothetical protein n=1 Tax=Pseudomonas syringae group genomosp. 7 TaxID=251699 RepID=UPI0037703874
FLLRVVLAKCFFEVVVGWSDDGGLLILDFENDGYAKGWSGEWVGVDHVVRKAEVDAPAAQFGIEQSAKWL